jgi:hypothetical protein
MIKISESISRVRGVFKAVKDDAFLTDRTIHSIILKYAKALIKRQDSERKLSTNNSLFEVLPYVELIEVDKIEADCAGIKTGCIIMRTKYKIPKLFEGSDGPLFGKIFSIDASKELFPTTPSRFISIQKSTSFKYNKTIYYWFKNGYVYIPNVTWEAIMIEGVWEEPLEGYCGIEEDCLLMQDKNLPIPEWLFVEIEQFAEQEMIMSGKVPSDNSDDNQNILR